MMAHNDTGFSERQKCFNLRPQSQKLAGCIGKTNGSSISPFVLPELNPGGPVQICFFTKSYGAAGWLTSALYII